MPAQPCCLVSLAKYRYFIDGVMNVNRAMNIGRAHQQRMDDGVGRGSWATTNAYDDYGSLGEYQLTRTGTCGEVEFDE